MEKITTGQTYEQAFQFSQEQVNAFALLSGDHNPIHLDAEYAAKTAFRRPIIHGFLAGSVFSKILGMDFPGEGSIYLNQTLSFLRPMYVDTAYIARLTVLEADATKRRARIKTEILEQESGRIMTEGEAEVLNKQRI
ncbi:MAG: MaoC family dehydratase [Bacteroidetes bacterium]|nr:MAG: MaoC family dehydratase [Bacteroidota bacterium]